MGLYRYEATDKAGGVLRGVLQARDEQQLAVMLNNRGLTLRTAYPPHENARANTQTPQSAGKPPATPVVATPGYAPGIASVTIDGLPVSIKSCANQRQLASFFRQFATLLRAGIPAFQATRDLTMATQNGKLRDATDQISGVLQQGGKLSSAMAQFPGVFPVHTIASVWCGEMVGRIDIAMDETAVEYEKEIKDYFLGKLGWFIAKSQFITLVAAIPLLHSKAQFMPNIGDAAEPTQMDVVGALKGMAMVYVKDVLPMTLLITGSVLAFWIGLGFIKRMPVVKRLTDKMVAGSPVWGKLHRYRGLARFLTIMERLTAAGIPTKEAWEAASLTPRSSEVAQRLRDAAMASAGGSAVELMRDSGLFSIEDVGIADAGDRAGSLPEMLGNLARLCQNRADDQAGKGRSTAIFMQINWLIISSAIPLIYLAMTYADLLKPLLDN